jgi:hypothetical protein
MSDHRLPDELAGIANRLAEERAVPTGAELDRMRQRATAGAGGSRRQTTRNEGATMKTRLAIVSMLAIGALFAATGSGLAVSGISGDEDASVSQYAAPPAGVTEEGVAGERREGVAQAGRQVVAAGEGDELPFTGYAAIPLIAVGVGLMIGGLAVRRRARPS